MSDYPTSVLKRVLEVEPMDTDDEVEQYDAMDHDEPKQAFVERLQQLGAHGRMLDIATGPGHIPLLICETFPGSTVTAIDLAPKMLALAHQRLADSSYADRIEYLQADAKAIPFADHTFSAVYSNTSLHHIPQPLGMLREAARVLKPGGVLLIRDLYRPADEDTLMRIVSEQTVEATPFQREMFADSLRAALTPDELLTLAREAGMRDVELVIDTDRHMSLQSVV